MKDLCDLLFELSSEERMNILHSLKQDDMKLSNIAQKLDMTVTEASRHLQRLNEVDLISRNPEGLYYITSFGELTLFLLPSLTFVSENRPYFLEHDISRLPYTFKNRISELSNYTFNKDTVIVFGHARDMILNAQEYIWLHSYQQLIWNAKIVVEKIRQGVDFRFILPVDYEKPEDFKPDITIEKRTRYLEKVDLRILITDKEASLSFPDKNGQIDYASFMSSDPVFRRWCRDLYLHYWENAKPAIV